MKFWQKTFLILLAVFVFTFNISMVIILHFTYEEELRGIKDKATGEAYFIASSLATDFASLEKIGNESLESKRSAFKNYSTYYKQKQVVLGLYKEESMVESSLPYMLSDGLDLEIEEDAQKIWTKQGEEGKYMVVMSRLLAPYEQYKLCYAYEISSLDTSSQRLMKMAIGVDIGMTILLGVILFLVLGKLTKPLMQLQKQAMEISKGHYGEIIEVKGSDEIADLGRQFNEMSQTIHQQLGMLQEENQKKQSLIDNMAHEFRTPLTSISGYAQYLMMASLDEEAKMEALDYIVSETARLKKLSHTLLYMAELREETLEMEEIHTKVLIENLEKLFNKQEHYKNVQFIATTGINSFQGNSMMVESLLINLIENSMRSCEEKGQVRLSIQKEQEQTLIEISDNGRGMSQEELEKIKEPFYRVDKARSRKMGGVGLGVSLCQQIVNLHGGTMDYSSSLGKGTKVVIKW